MFNITDFLQKFLNLEKDNNAKLAAILDVTKQATGLELSREMIEIKGDNLKINCNPCERSEIFMHCSQIEEGLKSQKIFLKLV